MSEREGPGCSGLHRLISRRIALAAGWLWLGMVVACLVAGWWPFTVAPANRVSWSADGGGLVFRPASVAFTAGPVLPAGESPPSSFTLEFYLTTGADAKSGLLHILSLHDATAPYLFAVCQWRTELLLRLPDSAAPRGFREVSVNVLQRVPRLVSIVCDEAGTAIHVDGHLMRRFPRFTVPAEVLRGRLVLGDAPVGKLAWTGTMQAVAVHGRAISSEEVASRHQSWASGDGEAVRRGPRPLALFRFTDGMASGASNLAMPSNPLEIPPRYRVLYREAFLWPRDPKALWASQKRDVIVNLLGFLPVGFVAAVYLQHRRGGRRWSSVGLATAAGCMVSLAIETGQIWLPTRVSSGADLVCNTAGSLFGALLAVWCVLPRHSHTSGDDPPKKHAGPTGSPASR